MNQEYNEFKVNNINSSYQIVNVTFSHNKPIWKKKIDEVRNYLKNFSIENNTKIIIKQNSQISKYDKRDLINGLEDFLK